MIGGRRLLGRSLSVGAAGLLMATLAACTGVGGGYLPPQSPAFSGQAPFGFTFSCQDAGGINPPTGRLKIEMAYSDRGTSAFLRDPFSIHGIVDEIDPVVESAFCIGKNPPPGNELIFLGRYSPTSKSAPGALGNCPRRQTATSPLCRFEVIVRDNDGDLAPSKGDYFSIKLSSATAVTSELDPTTVFYARDGLLAGGNITVK